MCNEWQLKFISKKKKAKITLYIRLPRERVARPLPPLPRGGGLTPDSGKTGAEPGARGAGAAMGLRRIIRGAALLAVPVSAGLGVHVIGTGLFTGIRLSPRPRAPGDEPRLYQIRIHYLKNIILINQIFLKKAL